MACLLSPARLFFVRTPLITSLLNITVVQSCSSAGGRDRYGLWTKLRRPVQVSTTWSVEVPVIARDGGHAIFKCPESVPARAATSLGSVIRPLARLLSNDRRKAICCVR
eukprot:3845072-Pleurochrysis_carterae.AAC.2